MKYVQKYILWIIGGAIGAISGFIYWKFIGCHAATCSITSCPINSTIYGTILGVLLFSIFEKDKKDKESFSKKS